MKETKDENPQDGLTKTAQVGAKSLLVMQDGKEPPDMLLALLNNALPSLVDSQQAKIMGTCLTLHKGKKVPTTIIFVFEVEPTSANTLESVGTLGKEAK